jgi:hypothetical protein
VVVIQLCGVTNVGVGVFKFEDRDLGLEVLIDDSLDTLLKSDFPCLFIEFSLSLGKLLLI